MDEISLATIRKIVRQDPKPADFTLVTVEANDGAIWLCVYENEIMRYEYGVRESIHFWLEKVRAEIAKSGLKVYLVGRPGDPPSDNS